MKPFKAMLLSLCLAAPSGAYAVAFPDAGGADTARFGGQLVGNAVNYSNNPGGWNPNEDYRKGQAIPAPVPAPTNAVKSGECDILLSNLISSECASYNGCANMGIQSVKPKITLRLAQIPGRDYSVACAGYIDQAFDNYKARRPDANVNFSGGYVEQKKPAPNIGVAAGGNIFPNAGGAFPETIGNISYMDRIENTTEGMREWKEVWEPKGPNGEMICVQNCAYASLFVESYAKYVDRMKTENFCAWCDQVPAGDDGCIKLLNAENIDSYKVMCPASQIIQGWTPPPPPPEPVAPYQPLPGELPGAGGGDYPPEETDPARRRTIEIMRALRGEEGAARAEEVLRGR